MLCGLQRNDELGSEGGAVLDADLLVDVAGDTEVDQVQLPSLYIVTIRSVENVLTNERWINDNEW